MYAILKIKYSSVHLEDREKVVQLLVDGGTDVNAQDQVIVVTRIA